MRKFIELPIQMLESTAYRSLSAVERALLIELQLRSENGSASLAVTDAAKQVRRSMLTTSNAFDG